MRYVILCFFCLQWSFLAYGWGSYGHQHISYTALGFSSDTPLGECMSKNARGMLWLASAPDEIFRNLPEKNRESYNHYFRLDFFLPNGFVNDESVKRLPSEPDFAASYSIFRNLLRENFEYINGNLPSPRDRLINPQIDIREVERQGLMLQRMIQLYDLGIEALKLGELKLGLYYLGLLSHYEGDQAQPFHTSGASEDGQSYKDPISKKKSNLGRGVHSAFGEGILNSYSRLKGFHPVEGVWTFGSTEMLVAQFAKKTAKKTKESISRETLLSESYRQILSGIGLIDPIQSAYAEAKKRLLDTGRTPHGVEDEIFNGAVEKHFSGAEVEVAGERHKILDLALSRLGSAAALLSRLWNQAYEEAKVVNPNLDKNLRNCPEIRYDSAYALQHYPPPSYLDEVSILLGRAAPVSPKRTLGSSRKPQN